jgi:hypothetical protein
MTKRKFWSYQTYDIKNKDIVDEIFSLKDVSGKKIISSIQKDIIWLIAR